MKHELGFYLNALVDEQAIMPWEKNLVLALSNDNKDKIAVAEALLRARCDEIMRMVKGLDDSSIGLLLGDDWNSEVDFE